MAQKAVANTKQQVPQKMSEMEKTWLDDTGLALEQATTYKSIAIRFEPIMFRASGIRYTPDFMHITPAGKVLFVEVKANTRQRGFRYSKTRLKVVAAAFPWFYFYLAVKTKSGWDIKEVYNGN